MTTEKRPLKVFLCHAHADRDPVRALYARLTKAVQAAARAQNPFIRYAIR